jgi:hypothetical protein
MDTSLKIFLTLIAAVCGGRGIFCGIKARSTEQAEIVLSLGKYDLQTIIFIVLALGLLYVAWIMPKKNEERRVKKI